MTVPPNVDASAPRPRVFVVDDDEITRTMLVEALSVDFEVEDFGDGKSAIEALEKRGAAGIIADHFMPGMTGVELLDASHQTRPETVRILMTATEHGAVFTEAVNRARVHRLLIKPLRFVELPSIVRGAIREAKLESENGRLLEELARSNARLEGQVKQRTRDLEAAVSRLEQLALRDGLTDLYNHRFVQEALDAELARCKRHGRAFSLLFIDVDYFKLYNDRNGHPAGDRLLKRLAQLMLGGRNTGLAPQGRASDLVARYGGEEFLIVLPETGIAGAVIKAEAVRRCIAEYPFEQAAAQPDGCVSVSIGVATFPDHGRTKAELIAAADRELYRAKHMGRNCVCAPAALSRSVSLMSPAARASSGLPGALEGTRWSVQPSVVFGSQAPPTLELLHASVQPPLSSDQTADTPAAAHPGVQPLAVQSVLPSPASQLSSASTADTTVEAVADPRKRVLVVDDSEIDGLVALEQLEELGYAVDLASNGYDAIQTITRGSYFAVVMDCQMPVMDGLEAALLIRGREGSGRRLPIIGVTGSEQREREKALASGMDNCLTKPLRMEALRKALAELDQVSEPQPQRAGYDDFDLDATTARSAALINMFLKLVPPQIDALGQAIATGDLGGTSVRAHKLKGGMLSLGARRMAAAASALEQMANDGTVADAPPELDALCRHFEVVRARLIEELLVVGARTAG